MERLLAAATTPTPPSADSPLSLVLALLGLAVIALGLGIILDRQGPPEGPRLTHDLAFARRIAAEPELLDRLTKRGEATTADVQPSWRTLDIPGGVLASACEPGADHEEVLGCWAFYANAADR